MNVPDFNKNLKFNKPSSKSQQKKDSSQSRDSRSQESSKHQTQTQTETESENECISFDLIQHVKNNREEFKKQFEEIVEEAKLKKLEKNRTLIPSSLQMIMTKYMENNVYANFVEVKTTNSGKEFIRHLLSINFEFDVPQKSRLQKIKPEFKSEVDRDLIKSIKIMIYSSDNKFKKTKLEKKFFNNNLRKITKNKIPKNLPSGLLEILDYLDYSILAEGLFHITKCYLGNKSIFDEEMIHDDFFLYIKISDVTYIKKPLQEMKENEVKKLVKIIII